MSYLLVQKIGMTRVFTKAGREIPVTVLRVPPNTVTQAKTKEKDGYDAVQIGGGDTKNNSKPLQGHLKKSGAKTRVLKEFKTKTPPAVGTKLTASQFKTGDLVRVGGISKGKGFAGVIKRHGFHRGPETHGSDHHRAPGSIGSMFPQRVVKGRRLPGHLGHTQITLHKREVIGVEDTMKPPMILLKGPLPGPRGTWITLQKETSEDRNE
jgi:large subunit ribosomal protein L3